MEDCIFCKIVRGEIPSKKEYEDDDLIAIHDIHPLAPVHILIIPKKHIAKLAEAVEDDRAILGKIQLVAAEIAKKVGIGDAFRVSNANGSLAGQSVFHIHYHLRGGWKDQAPEDK
jgi:histidine triad (HIT) family protein